MDDRSAKIALIGAGPVGLCVAKALKARHIEYDHLEADGDVGGNWYHGVYAMAHIISSKKTTEYPDYPMPSDYPDFPSAAQMLAYLRDYADHFGLREQMQLGAKVVMAVPLADARWQLTLASGETRIYKGVIVCNGHHWDKKFPAYSGKFAGEIIHSKDYKQPSQLASKRVLVVGGGNSACDLAAEAARVGASCDLSLRRGYWFLPKTVLGIPSPELILPWVPVWLQRLFVRAAVRVVVGRYEDYGLPKPEHKIFEPHPTLNSELLHYIKHGRIRPRPDIKRYDGSKVEFVDGTSAEFDPIACATGFHVSFPFLPEGLVPVRGAIAELYGGMFLADYKNLCVVGTGQLRYGFGPVFTPAAELIADMVRLQDQMEFPIGFVLREAGAKTPTTHLVDPHAAIREARRARRVLPALLKKERQLRQERRAPVPPRTADSLRIGAAGDLQVY